MPQETLGTIDELLRIGLTDEHFAEIHHFRPRETTIAGHQYYCEYKVETFNRNGENQRTKERLQKVLELKQNGRSWGHAIEQAWKDHPLVKRAAP